MAKRREVYHCEICGNIVEVEFGGKGALVCCGEDMKLLTAQTADMTKEKHVPYVLKEKDGYRVKVGKEVDHPMVDKHYISYIEICADGIIMRKYLNPGDKPEAFFKTDAAKVEAWEVCNIHGLWKA